MTTNLMLEKKLCHQRIFIAKFCFDSCRKHIIYMHCNSKKYFFYRVNNKADQIIHGLDKMFFANGFV